MTILWLRRGRCVVNTSMRRRECELGFVYDTDLCGQPLECGLDYEPPEVGDRETPSYPAVYRLSSVCVSGVNIMGLISDQLIREIEEAACEYYERGKGWEEDEFWGSSSGADGFYV